MMSFDLGGFDQQPVTTIRISNIPSHTNEADFNFWFLFAKGFQQGTLAPARGGAGTQTGWARFASVEDAQVAMQTLDGRQLVESPEGGALAVEFAKKNFKPPNPMKKRPYEEDQSGYGQDQSGYGQDQSGYGQDQSGYGQFDPKFDGSQYGAASQLGAVQAQTQPASQAIAQYDPSNFDPTDYGAYLADLGKGVQGATLSIGAGAAGMNSGMNSWTANSNAMTNTNRSSGSTTLFVGRLADTVTEEEMNQVFPSLHGFERLKFVPPTDGKSGMCFAKFYTAETAEEALRVLSGYRLPSSPGTPLQVQFAKNDLDQPSGRGLGGGPPAAATSAWGATTSPMQSALAAAPLRQGNNGECDTMFIGNLASMVTEHDLSRVLQAYPGFVRLKFVMGPRPMAFALFDGVPNCQQAIDSMHGQALPTAPEQAMLCQFAKNSLDKPTPKWARQF
mmetsp:Transcript_116217/g.211447  ORF Transcript_116217/g.211447 Transcript_116217/m.211447 type:complete len:447 (-) Transcript_116217:48-1388(-)